MKIDPQCRYTKSHEWARKEGDVIVIGITDYAQQTLSDIVYVELPEEGDEITKGEAFGVAESVKAASDVYAPVSGEVVAVNERLEDEPEVVNSDPFGEGWFIKVRPSDESEWDSLLTPEEYERVVAEEESH